MRVGGEMYRGGEVYILYDMFLTGQTLGNRDHDASLNWMI